jgi:riboflavin synthase
LPLFTGLVEGEGVVAEQVSEGSALRLAIEVPVEFGADGEVGDSLALNGCCLTVVEKQGRRWSFQAGEETLSKTNLQALRVGERVNLERALPVGGRLGGHFVQGHVDGVGIVDRIDTDGEWTTMWFSVPEGLTQQMVGKGSVAVDGVSLTVVQVARTRFSVVLIPHTLAVTTLGSRQVGALVNIETDILGKYVQKLLATQSEHPIVGPATESAS